MLRTSGRVCAQISAVSSLGRIFVSFWIDIIHTTASVWRRTQRLEQRCSSIRPLTLFFVLCSSFSHVLSFLLPYKRVSPPFSLSLPLSPVSPQSRLAQSLLRVRKQTQIILAALLACDGGLASCFNWERMEIITANWHQRRLARPHGEKKRKKRRRQRQVSNAPKKKERRRTFSIRMQPNTHQY